MRQVVLDTETTGLETTQGHRIIEIGCVELIDRKLTGKTYHQYINPERIVDDGAIEIHGITNEFLVDKPVFSAIYDDFLEFVQGSELVIHNAPFDVGFINHEIVLLAKQANHNIEKIDSSCTILDTLKLARALHPGQRNTLDALGKRYFIDISNRQLHGALLDSEILADVYLAMTGGQTDLKLDDTQVGGNGAEVIQKLTDDRQVLSVIRANSDELKAHEEYLDMLDKTSANSALWRKVSV